MKTLTARPPKKDNPTTTKQYSMNIVLLYFKLCRLNYCLRHCILYHNSLCTNTSQHQDITMIIRFIICHTKLTWKFTWKVHIVAVHILIYISYEIIAKQGLAQLGHWACWGSPLSPKISKILYSGLESSLNNSFR